MKSQNHSFSSGPARDEFPSIIKAKVEHPTHHPSFHVLLVVKYLIPLIGYAQDTYNPPLEPNTTRTSL